MAWLTITQNEQDDVIVAAFKAGEMDLFQLQTSQQKYEIILLAAPDSDWRTKIEKVLAGVRTRVSEVQQIVDAMRTQLPDANRIQASLTRLASK